MKIGVNGWFLLKPFTGIGQYTKNWLINVPDAKENNHFLVVVPEELPKSVSKLFAKNVEVVVLPQKKLVLKGAKKTWWEQIQVPEFFIKKEIDKAFFPYPSNPWTKDWYQKKIKTAVVVHDCIPWIDHQYQQGVLSKMYQKQSKNAVKLADRIYTVSGESKKDVVSVCGADEEKIKVIYNDVGEGYKESVSDTMIKKVLKQFSLNREEYFLYVGGYDKRKNVDKLLKEFEIFGQKIPLVLVGGKAINNKMYQSFDEDNPGNVVKTGFISEENLAALYSGCRAFINLSRLEGFNLPILEAANCGAAMALSDIAVHREVAEGAPLYVNMKGDGAAAQAMEKLMNDNVITSLKQNSKKLVKKYSWEKYAKMYTWNF